MKHLLALFLCLCLLLCSCAEKPYIPSGDGLSTEGDIIDPVKPETDTDKQPDTLSLAYYQDQPMNP